MGDLWAYTFGKGPKLIVPEWQPKPCEVFPNLWVKRNTTRFLDFGHFVLLKLESVITDEGPG